MKIIVQIVGLVSVVLLAISILFRSAPSLVQAQTVVTKTVCPVGTTGQGGCDFIGASGIQNAINTIPDGTSTNPNVILIKKGVYTDVQLQIGMVANTKKSNIRITGEDTETVLDGGQKGDIFYIGFASNITITNLTIRNAKTYGIYVRNDVSVSIVRNVLSGNSGLGIYSVGNSQVTVINNIFYANGGGVNILENAQLTVINNIAMNNKNGAFRASAKERFTKLEYNIAYGNSADWNTGWGEWPPVSNKIIDPKFVNAAAGDLYLLVDSPALNAGDPTILNSDGTKSHIGAFGLAPGLICGCLDGSCSTICTLEKFSDITYSTPLKCALADSLFSTPQTNKTAWCKAPKRTKGDANGDGVINMLDYFYYVAAASGGKIPLAVNPDFNGDGVVNVSDIAIILKSLNP